MEIKPRGPRGGQSHIRHQVDFTVGQGAQASLPETGHRLELPALLLGDMKQQIAENARGLTGFTEENFGGIFVHANPQVWRFWLTAGLRGHHRQGNNAGQ